MFNKHLEKNMKYRKNAKIVQLHVILRTFPIKPIQKHGSCRVRAELKNWSEKNLVLGC